VEDVVTNGQFILLETLVRRCADAILAYDEAITEVSVRVAKLVPPVPQRVATVGVRTTRTR
jgi:dihydroneopterin aldolase